MTDCERCKDVHRAQELGMTNKPCECDCHLLCPLPSETTYPSYSITTTTAPDLTASATVGTLTGDWNGL